MNSNQKYKKYLINELILFPLKAFIIYKFYDIYKNRIVNTINFQENLRNSLNNNESFIFDPLWRSKIRKPISNAIISNQNNILLIAGTGNKDLAIEISDRLNLQLSKIKIAKNEDDEIGICLDENPEGKELFIIQPISPPVNSNITELLFLISECKRAGAKKINIIIPYLGYSTVTSSLDHKMPIYSADISRMIEIAGADSVSSIELHAGQIEGFYKIPINNVSSNIILCEYLYNSNLIKNLNNLIIVSPDENGVKRAKNLADSLAKKTGIHINMAFTISHKEYERELANNYSNSNSIISNNDNKFIKVIGNVKNFDCIIIDDLIKSGNTIFDSAEELKRQGANKVIAFSTHCKKFY